jgi:MoxR-like ATPase
LLASSRLDLFQRKGLALYQSIDDLQSALAEQAYVADRPLATAIYLALKLRKPLLLEGEAGVGKTEVAKVLQRLLGARLIRLQCYEGLDISTAVYEWNYPRQMLYLRAGELAGSGREQVLHDIFGPEFLLRRPLLEAIEAGDEQPPVLLVDELDRADDEFEAYLLEVLSDFQITIPEIGTISARQTPIVVLTSNRTREVHDALKRRCLYHWIEYPSFEKELAIVRARVPDASTRLTEQIVAFIQELRQHDLYKLPGIAETLDWATALAMLDRQALDPATVDDTLGAILKYQDDIQQVRKHGVDKLVQRATTNQR